MNSDMKSDMTIFEALRKSHDEQRRLLGMLVQTEGDSAPRDDLFNRLKAELANHAGAEERALYIPMMEHDMTQEKARHSVAEHHEIDELVEKLEATDYSSSAWLTTAKQLEHLVTHHLEEEEQEVFQLAGRALDDAAKHTLADVYLADMKARETA